jgi:uncharacterized RmlC-like cupin family protein
MKGDPDNSMPGNTCAHARKKVGSRCRYMTRYLPKRRGKSRSLAQTTQWIGLSGVLRMVHTWQQEAEARAHQHDALQQQSATRLTACASGPQHSCSANRTTLAW